MRRTIFAFAIATLLTTAGPAAFAATFSTAPADGGALTVTLNGEISEGDAADFKAIVRSAEKRGKSIAMIRLNSPGGSILESIKIAEIVRSRGAATSVVGGSNCASACFIVFAAGGKKLASYGAAIGVHGASNSDGEETAQSSSATITMARVVKELGVPPSIIGKMVVTPPDDIVWLTPDELQSMGTTMIGEARSAPVGLETTSHISPEPDLANTSQASQSGQSE
jgi:hypothetical protein